MPVPTLHGLTLTLSRGEHRAYIHSIFVLLENRSSSGLLLNSSCPDLAYGGDDVKNITLHKTVRSQGGRNRRVAAAAGTSFVLGGSKD